MSTTTDFFLDRDLVEELEPVENDATGMTSLSGFAIPRHMVASVFGGYIARFEFRYETPKLRGEAFVRIDELENPAILVEYSTGIRRILRVEFAPKVLPHELDVIADRIERAAPAEANVGKRLSLKLIAKLIREAPGGKFGEWPHAPSVETPQYSASVQ